MNVTYEATGAGAKTRKPRLLIFLRSYRNGLNVETTKSKMIIGTKYLAASWDAGQEPLHY